MFFPLKQKKINGVWTIVLQTLQKKLGNNEIYNSSKYEYFADSTHIFIKHNISYITWLKTDFDNTKTNAICMKFFCLKKLML